MTKLQTSQFQELDQNELQEINGGTLPLGGGLIQDALLILGDFVLKAAGTAIAAVEISANGLLGYAAWVLKGLGLIKMP